MNHLKHFANVNTPFPGPNWVALNEQERLALVLQKLQSSPKQFLAKVRIIQARLDGQIIMLLNQTMSASQRGPFLLDLEEYLKLAIDDALNVWLEPLGDRNSLRNLRGIEVKA
jgi:hypothetical protein